VPRIDLCFRRLGQANDRAQHYRSDYEYVFQAQ
jgi:hypothetical protein